MPNVVLIVSIPDIYLLPYFKYSLEYRLTRSALCYTLRSNSGWLPIRCAYFILYSWRHFEFSVNDLKFPTFFIFLFSNKMLVSRGGMQKMLLRMAYMEDPDRTASSVLFAGN